MNSVQGWGQQRRHVSTEATCLSVLSMGDPQHLWFLYRSYMPVCPIYGRPTTLVVSLQELHACLTVCRRPTTLVMSLHELHACLLVCGKPIILVMSLQELHACLPICGKPKTLVMSLHELHACLPVCGNPKHS